MQVQKAKQRVIFCGGTGMNIGGDPIFKDDPRCVYLDTSNQNLNSNTNEDNSYVIEVDTSSNDVHRRRATGAGGDREFIYPHVVPHIPSIMHNFGNADFYVVVFSMSGGSGSVIGPLVMSHLLQQGESVIGVVVRSLDDAVTIKNSWGTLKSFEGIAHLTHLPPVVAFHNNVAGVPQTEINQHAIQTIQDILFLTSQEHDRLDLMDVVNWVQFTKKHHLPAQLLELQIFDNRSEAAAVLEPLSVASLYADENKIVPFGSPLTVRTGIINDAEANPDDQLHFVINAVGIETISKDIEKARENMAQVKARMTRRASLISVDDKTTNTGLTF